MKSREKFLEKFTADGEIDEWVVGDECTELHGFVDLIEGMKIVTSNGKPTNLYKITVNNGSNRRVKVCFWGELAKTYTSQIQDRTVISIVRCRTVIPKKSFRNPNDIVETLELYVLPATEIEISNEKFPDDNADITESPLIEIENLCEHSEQCFIEGYLKQEFKTITAFGANFSSGLLVKGNFKISVKVAQNNETKKYTKGTFLRVLGKLTKNSHPVPQFVVRSFQDITANELVQALGEKELKVIGYRTPKRKMEHNADENYAKRSPF